WIVSSIKPDLTPTPAKAGDAEAGRVCFAGALCPRDRSVEGGRNLTLRRFCSRRGYFLHTGLAAYVSPSCLKRWRAREITRPFQAAADVLDMLVSSKDLVDNEDGGKWPTGRGHRAIAGNLAALNRDLHLSRDETIGIGGDGLGRDRHHRERKPRGETRHHEFTPRKTAA